MFSFQHSEYLFALVGALLLVFLYFSQLRWKKNTIKKIGDERLVKEMIKDYSPKKFALKFILAIIAFTLGVLALANLQKPNGEQKVSRNGIDVMIALDVSKSMLAQDIKPSRIERAKQFLSKLIDKLNNDRIGIVVFAGKAYLQMPLTGDIGAAKMYLSSTSPDMVPTQGTVIGDALKMCFQSFNPKEKKYKAVILVSDGEDHDEEAGKIAGQMAEEGVVINTVGIGSPEGTTIIDPLTNEPKKDKDGNTVITKLNEDELKTLAKKGNGEYQLYTNTEDVANNLAAQLGSMDKRAVTDDSLINYKSFFQYFLLLAFILLVIELFVSERVSRRKTTDNRQRTTDNERRAAANRQRPTTNLQPSALILISLIILPYFGTAQNSKEIIKKGNEAYLKNEYEKAAEQYKKVTEKTPENATAQFNLGNALYKNKKTDEAINAFDNAAKNLPTKTEKANAFYNKGVVYQNNKKLQECIKAYKEALKLNPNDDDARQNLQKALQQQKQQQQQQKENKNQQKPKEDQKQKEQQKNKDQQKNDQPQQPSKLTKKDAEEKLKSLLQQEKNLQDKLHKANVATPNRPEKDW